MRRSSRPSSAPQAVTPPARGRPLDGSRGSRARLHAARRRNRCSAWATASGTPPVSPSSPCRGLPSGGPPVARGRAPSRARSAPWGRLSARVGAGSLAAVLLAFRRAAAVAPGVGTEALVGGAFRRGDRRGARLVVARAVRAVIEDGHVLLTGLPRETRTFLVAFSGVGDWRRGVAELLYSAAMWAGAAVLLEVVSLWKTERAAARRRLRAVAVILPVLLAAALLGGASGAVVFSAAPLVSFAALVAGLRRPGRRAPPRAASALGSSSATAAVHIANPLRGRRPLRPRVRRGLLRRASVAAARAARVRTCGRGGRRGPRGVAFVLGPRIRAVEGSRSPGPGAGSRLARTSPGSCGLAGASWRGLPRARPSVSPRRDPQYLSRRRNPLLHKLYLRLPPAGTKGDPRGSLARRRPRCRLESPHQRYGPSSRRDYGRPRPMIDATTRCPLRPRRAPTVNTVRYCALKTRASVAVARPFQRGAEGSPRCASVGAAS